MENDDMFDFDPYQTMMDMSHAIDALITSHNQLVDDYATVKKRLRIAEDRILKLEIFMMSKEIK